jgi:protein phosphatase 2C family protein 2/3
MDSKLKSFGGNNNQRGRIILLGDGTEVLTDSDDTELFDPADEDKDLDSQVHKGQVTGHESKNAESKVDALPEKADPTHSDYKAVAAKVLSNSSEPTDKKTNKPTPDTQTK